MMCSVRAIVLIQLVSSSLSALLFSQPVLAQSKEKSAVFKSVDAQGRATYSTTPGDSAAPAELPSVQRESFDNRIRKLKEIGSKHCDAKGGIDCEKGPNGEFVYCMDGTPSSYQRYAEFCSLAVLQKQVFVEFATEPTLRLHRDVYKQLRAVDPRPPIAFIVELRNTSPVKAEVQSVLFKLPFLSPRKSPLDGPHEVEAYGLAQYRIEVGNLPQGNTPRHLAEAEAAVTCSNCSTVKGN
jgi:hypothetical protein